MKPKAVKRMGFETAKATFVHRFTMEHFPKWANNTLSESTRSYPAPTYRTDWEWYLNTKFPGDSGYRGRKYCESRNATWPLGMTLDRPYSEFK